MASTLRFSPDRMGSIPGPRSLELNRRRESLLPRGIFNFHPLFIRRAEGALIEDVDGNVLIDFAGGIGCLNVGHTAPEVVAAVAAQAKDYVFSCFHVAMHEPYLKVAEKLAAAVGGSSPRKVMLVNSGAEAVENAIKIARAWTKRPAVITFENAFHGRTLLALALTSKTKTYKAGFAPFPAEIYRLPFAYCYRCPIHQQYPDCAVACSDLLDDFFEKQVPAHEVAALIVEPVQGEGGFIVPPQEYLPRLQETCRRHGILLVVDEVQTGIARAGSLFAYQTYGLDPDLVILSKSLAAGLPLSAVIGSADIMDAPQVGGLGGTFGGNALACAAAETVLDKVAREHLSERAAEIGRTLVERAHRWQAEFERIGDIRALGAMVGIEFVEDRETRRPAPELVRNILDACLRQGLLLISAGTYSNVVRFLIPLVIDDGTLDQGLDILEGVLRNLDA